MYCFISCLVTASDRNTWGKLIKIPMNNMGLYNLHSFQFIQPFQDIINPFLFPFIILILLP